jgi:hypothetical protein
VDVEGEHQSLLVLASLRRWAGGHGEDGPRVFESQGDLGRGFPDDAAELRSQPAFERPGVDLDLDALELASAVSEPIDASGHVDRESNPPKHGGKLDDAYAAEVRRLAELEAHAVPADREA